ncbi:nuclear transport factor 2 family protein [Pedobacter sp. KBS0701]|uniref:nuclear transport factor 2 family protein n=1 Tax=unclassified Pedobacter TaxID=2628915 RepID=UPI00110E6321|nr:nuclear transport factor 2 family protein [Pedobacter sp. KBS0701]QDW24722.1 nuclear transport factor 2 family protein [Pedobacter sp. KBS0701]
MRTSNKITTEHNAKVVVLDFINALNAEEFDLARQQLKDDMIFKGVMGERNGADIYIKDMKKMKFKYDVKKVFVDQEEVCLWYDINMGEKTIFSSGWYKLEDGKIKSFQVIFDPRPIL